MFCLKIVPRARGAPGAMVGQTCLPFLGSIGVKPQEEPFWVQLGPSWGLLGPSLGFLGPLGAILESKCTGKAKILIFPTVFDGFGVHLGAILGPSWGLLGPSWGHLGAILGPLGASWGLLGPSWLHLGAILGPLGASWGLLGPSWSHLGAILGLLGAPWGHLGAIMGPSWGCLLYTSPSPRD